MVLLANNANPNLPLQAMKEYYKDFLKSLPTICDHITQAQMTGFEISIMSE
jgi:hypothetical protein